MQIIDLLSRERVRIEARVRSKKHLLEMASEVLAGDDSSADARAIFSSLCARERLGSTGLGHGVAIPHGRMGARDVAGAFIRLHDGVDFEAPDSERVDLVFALVVPEQCRDEHLRLLAQLAEMFSDEQYRDRLRRAGSSAEVLELLESWQGQTVT